MPSTQQKDQGRFAAAFRCLTGPHLKYRYSAGTWPGPGAPGIPVPPSAGLGCITWTRLGGPAGAAVTLSAARATGFEKFPARRRASSSRFKWRAILPVSCGPCSVGSTLHSDGLFTHIGQLWAQSRHFFAQCRIRSSSRIASQLSAHASQISAQAVQIAPCCGEWRRKEFAVVWHISAQSSSNARWAAVTCIPPFSVQYRAVSRQAE
jgi:hypothetical protein